MRTLTRNTSFLSRLRACLTAPLRWLKLDGKDAASRAMRHELLLSLIHI